MHVQYKKQNEAMLQKSTTLIIRIATSKGKTALMHCSRAGVIPGMHLPDTGLQLISSSSKFLKWPKQHSYY